MTEKRKWFDPSSKPNEPLQLISSGGVTHSDFLEFTAWIAEQRSRGKLAWRSHTLLAGLCGLTPVLRLGRNHKVVIGLLAKVEIRNVLAEGLTSQEKTMLRDLEHQRAPPKIRAVAQGLLNVHERQELVDAAKMMYRTERTRFWKSNG